MSENENKNIKKLEAPPTPAKSLKSRDKIRSSPNHPIEYKIMLAGESEPQVEVDLIKFDERLKEIKISIHNQEPGVHAFPPPIQSCECIPFGDVESVQADAYLPDHLPFRPLPDSMPKEIHVRTVFPEDERKVYKDTSYPWSTIGRVETPKEVGTGVLVGPRHLLTCGHMIKWKSDGTADFLKFTPAYYDGSAPFGHAYATNIYYPEGIKIYTDQMTFNEVRHDFVVVVLNTNIGKTTGYMGYKPWAKSWNDRPDWIHCGYPFDLTSNNKPTYQKAIALKGEEDLVHTLFEHKADIYHGQSGGPFFGYWDSKPYVVAIQSASTPSLNYACGSQHMVQLINQALHDYP